MAYEPLLTSHVNQPNSYTLDFYLQRGGYEGMRKALGMTPESARARFGFFLDALEYGTPPHGGFAAGIERTCMILCGTENIRDVMAFPKTASAQDLMMDSPGDVDEAQLEELGIAVTDQD